MNLLELKDFLDKNDIPVYKRIPKTFLEITKQPHYENVISNIYAFFFNVNEEHGLKDLFIKSLIDCIEEQQIKDKNFTNFIDFNIETEYPTRGKGKFGKKGRIDLLLHNNQQAIIIENKIFHHLNNDLDDYWQSVKINSENLSSKIGIILSLRPISKDQYSQFETRNHYINITHATLMHKIKDNSISYLPGSESNYIFLFHDFYQNIMKLSHQMMKKDDIHFYINNKSKINQIVLFKQQFKKHIISEVDHAGMNIKNAKLLVPRNKFNSRRLRYYESTKHNNLVYTIVFGELLEDSNILHIIIEPKGNTLKNGAMFKNITFDENEKLILKNDFYSKTNERWAHFASKSYVLDEANIAHLSNFIQDKIVEDGFASILTKMEKLLTDFRMD